jgi:ubiquinone/menaquinone biosynthesis C-methylase UbiE
MKSTRESDSSGISEFKTGAWAAREDADRYHAATIGASELFKLLRRDLYVRYVQRNADPGACILDLGCGTGLISIALHDLGYSVVACDVSSGMLSRLSAERGERAFELRQGNGADIPAENGEFDVVISRMFLQHFPDWPKILREKARVTRAGGIVLFDFGNREHVNACDPNLGSQDDFPYCADVGNPAKFYAVADEQEMHKTAAECGLEVVQIAPYGLLLYNAFLWNSLGSRGIGEFSRQLDVLLAHKEAKELLFLIEETLLPLLPKSVCYGNVTILRRNSQPILE